MLMVGDFAHHDWSTIPVTQHRGETGTAFQQALNAGPFRIRKMRYSNGYRADHWCERGHIVLVVAGSAEIEFDGDRTAHIDAGHIFWMSDGDGPHRMYSKYGAELYIVDEEL